MNGGVCGGILHSTVIVSPIQNCVLVVLTPFTANFRAVSRVSQISLKIRISLYTQYKLLLHDGVVYYFKYI